MQRQLEEEIAILKHDLNETSERYHKETAHLQSALEDWKGKYFDCLKLQKDNAAKNVIEIKKHRNLKTF